MHFLANYRRHYFVAIIIIANLYRTFEIYENIQRLYNSQTRYMMCYR